MNLPKLTNNVISLLPFVKIGGVIIGIAITSMFVLAQFNQKQDQLDIYIEQAKQFKADAEAASAFADSLKLEVEQNEQEAAEAQARAEELASTVVSLRAQTNELRNRRDEIRSTIVDGETITLELATELIPLQDSIIEQQEVTIQVQETQIAELYTVIERKDLSILLLTTSVDSLQTVIANIPPPPSNPNKLFGFINLPSRKTVAIVTFAAGVITTLSVTK
jgi:chromosome segregation ATPase